MFVPYLLVILVTCILLSIFCVNCQAFEFYDVDDSGTRDRNRITFPDELGSGETEVTVDDKPDEFGMCKYLKK